MGQENWEEWQCSFCGAGNTHPDDVCRVCHRPRSLTGKSLGLKPDVVEPLNGDKSAEQMFEVPDEGLGRFTR